MENKQTWQKQGTCRTFVSLLWEFPSITIFSVGKYFGNIVKIILWKKFHNRILNCSNIILTIFGNFSQQAPILCVYLVFGGLTMAAPMGHLTIKFNSIKFNSLGLLVMISNIKAQKSECFMCRLTYFFFKSYMEPILFVMSPVFCLDQKFAHEASKVLKMKSDKTKWRKTQKKYCIVHLLKINNIIAHIFFVRWLWDILFF